MLHNVNMTPTELRKWAANWRHSLASTATGLRSLRRLPRLLSKPFKSWTDDDLKFAAKVDAFIERHITQRNLFGAEVKRSGWSRRHIALRNWGHDPSKRSSPAFNADRHWRDNHPGATERRRA